MTHYFSLFDWLMADWNWATILVLLFVFTGSISMSDG